MLEIFESCETVSSFKYSGGYYVCPPLILAVSKAQMQFIASMKHQYHTNI